MSLKGQDGNQQVPDNTKFYRLSEFLEFKHDKRTLDDLAGMVVQCINEHQEMGEVMSKIELSRFTVGVDPTNINLLRQCGINQLETTRERSTVHNQHILLTRVWGDIWLEASVSPTANRKHFAQFFLTHLTAEQKERIMIDGVPLDCLRGNAIYEEVIKKHGPLGKQDNTHAMVTTFRGYLSKKQESINIEALARDLLDLLDYLETNGIQFQALTIADIGVVYSNIAITTKINQSGSVRRRSSIDTPEGKAENLKSVWESIFQLPQSKDVNFILNVVTLKQALLREIQPAQEEKIIRNMRRVTKKKTKNNNLINND